MNFKESGRTVHAGPRDRRPSRGSGGGPGLDGTRSPVDRSRQRAHFRLVLGDGARVASNSPEGFCFHFRPTGFPGLI